MRSWYIAFLAAIISLAGSAVYSADGTLRVKGKIVDQSGTPFHLCTVELFIPADKDLLSVYRGTIESSFDFSIAGPPSREPYIVGISCRGAKNSYRSNPVEIGGKVATDVGDIILERE